MSEDLPVWLVEREWKTKQELARLRGLLKDARMLVNLLSVDQIIEAGDAAIQAAGLDPWCLNEGTADRKARLNAWRFE